MRPGRIQYNPDGNNWKRESGVLCDRIISLRVKGKVYKTIVTPAMVYAAATWAVKKSQYVAEMRVLKMDEWSLTKLLRKEEEYVGPMWAKELL